MEGQEGRGRPTWREKKEKTPKLKDRAQKKSDQEIFTHKARASPEEMCTECMKISSPHLTKGVFHGSSTSCLHLPSPVTGGREAELQEHHVPSKGTISFLHCSKPQITFQRFTHHISSQRETKARLPGRAWPPLAVTSPCSMLLPTARIGPQDSRGPASSGAVLALALAVMGEIPTAAARGEAGASGVICVQNLPSTLMVSTSQLIPSKNKTLHFCLRLHIQECRVASAVFREVPGAGVRPNHAC